MSKQAVFMMTLDPELHAEFMAAPEAAHRPASQMLGDRVREFVRCQHEADEYDAYLRRKVEVGRVLVQAGQGRSNDEVEAEFAARRVRVRSRS